MQQREIGRGGGWGGVCTGWDGQGGHHPVHCVPGGRAGQASRARSPTPRGPKPWALHVLCVPSLLVNRGRHTLTRGTHLVLHLLPPRLHLVPVYGGTSCSCDAQVMHSFLQHTRMHLSPGLTPQV